jgi:hypothetical protein
LLRVKIIPKTGLGISRLWVALDGTQYGAELYIEQMSYFGYIKWINRS